MNKEESFEGILNSFPFPVVFVDLNHIVRYVNAYVRAKRQSKGKSDLIGESILDCHSDRSRARMLQIFEHFQTGGGEVFLRINEEGQRTYMTPVRNSAGQLLGYYERYEI